ncbi:MAG: tRNA-dihydrouridine synthase [Coriobacteriia bacterium]|nr:tRNA-dihydrouridine synthase [Coriobacteriia bacterium]
MNEALNLSGSKRILQFIEQNPFWLAPMAGVNDACFRGICKRMGAGITYTEMISAIGLHYNFETDATRRLLAISDNESPVAAQLFGSDAEVIATQAYEVAQFLGEDLAFIDINMGCPVTKVVRRGEGSALMMDLDTASRIVKKTVTILKAQGLEGSDIPVTVKFRRGYSEGDDRSVEFACAMEGAGASALAVHGRYQDQFYSGVSDRQTITRVKDAVGIPVIGSGDVFSAQDALSMISPKSKGGVGADAVMIARGAQGDPWIFTQAQALHHGELPLTPSYEDIFAVMQEHATCIERSFGPKALVRMRKHAMWYCAGLPGASYFRGKINQVTTMNDLESLISEYKSFLAKTVTEISEETAQE